MIIVFFVLTLFMVFQPLNAQVPQAFKYQAIARDGSGHPLVNQQISLRISIIDSAASGIIAYQELHKEGTNGFGLVTISVGRGLPMVGIFKNIEWSTGNKWIRIEMDETGGTNFTDMGIYQLLSVPYALYAESSATAFEDTTDELQTLSITGHQLSISRGNTVTLPDNVNDADADPSNELNTAFTLSGTTLSLTDAGGTLSVDLSGLNSGSGAGNAWLVSGNSNTNPALHFVGTTDQADLVFKTDNTEKMRILTSGTVAIGHSAPHPSAIVDVASTNKGVLYPCLTTQQRLAISSPATGLMVYDITGNILMQYNGSRWIEVGAPPIGTIQAWHKSLSGTPPLPWGWMECNGQVVTDAESPYNGVAVPNLNAVFTTEAGVTSSAGRFLRGGSVSGVMSADKTNNVSVIGSSGSNGCGLCDAVVPQDGTFPIGNTPGYDRNNANTSMRIRHRAVETHPGNMTVVWIIRIK
jgi:hypothetical protein